MSFPSEFETGSEMLKLGGDGELVNTAECLSLENTYKKKKMLECWFATQQGRDRHQKTAEGLVR